MGHRGKVKEVHLHKLSQAGLSKWAECDMKEGVFVRWMGSDKGFEEERLTVLEI